MERSSVCTLLEQVYEQSRVSNDFIPEWLRKSKNCYKATRSISFPFFLAQIHPFIPQCGHEALVLCERKTLLRYTVRHSVSSKISGEYTRHVLAPTCISISAIAVDVLTVAGLKILTCLPTLISELDDTLQHPLLYFSWKNKAFTLTFTANSAKLLPSHKNNTAAKSVLIPPNKALASSDFP